MKCVLDQNSELQMYNCTQLNYTFWVLTSLVLIIVKLQNENVGMNVLTVIYEFTKITMYCLS
jgi:hypothetical protein